MKINFYLLALIFVLSLTPLLWFKPNTLISSVDVNQTFFPNERFIDRTYLWYPKVAGGSDRANDIASLPFILPQAVLSSIGFDVISIEKITFVFWFFLTGLAMYFLASVVIAENTPHREKIIFASVAAYLFNFYLPFIWARLQLAITTLALFPFLLGLLIGLLQKKFSLRTVLFLLPFIAFIGAPIGIQPPLMMIMFAMLLFYFIFHNLYFFRPKKIGKLFNSLYLFLFFIFTYLLSSLFWLIPLGHFIFQSDYITSSVGIKVYAVNDLLIWVNSFTALKNTLRLFGDVSYFDVWGGQRYLEQFIPYETNSLLVLLSFSLPILAFSALLIKNQNKKIISFFLFITLLGLFFGKGTNPPLGDTYSWLIDNLPLFWIQRAPWQKFTILTVIGYSILAGTAFGTIYGFLLAKLKNRLLALCAWTTLLFLLIIGYNYFFLFGKMFPTSEIGTGFNHKYNLSFHLNSPDYIFKARDWINNKKDYFKIMLLPDDKTNVYDWGYSGTVDITDIVINKPIIQHLYGEGYSPPQPIQPLYSSFINSTYNQYSSNSAELLRLMGVKYLLQRNDFNFDFYGDSDSPEFIKTNLGSQNGISLITNFGKWDLYQVSRNYPVLYVPDTVIYTNQEIVSLSLLINSNLLNLDQNIMFKKQDDYAFADHNSVVLNETQSLHNVKSSDGQKYPFSWNKAQDQQKPEVEARFYRGDKHVISYSNLPGEDMLVFPASEPAPYKFYSGETAWSAFNSTLIYISTGDEPFFLSGIYLGDEPVPNIVGIWWESGFAGASTRTLNFPVKIPPNQKAIIQIGKLLKNKNITVVSLPNSSPDSVKIIDNKIIANPIVEFKQLSPVKYLVNLHQARKTFPLVFLEQFNKDWQISPLKIEKDSLNFENSRNLLSKYKILADNEDTHADLSELTGFLNSGYVSSLGDGKLKIKNHKTFSNWREKITFSENYYIDYISKLTRSSIQNDNLLSVNLEETFFSDPLLENKHFVANSYANGWIIEPDVICQSTDNCSVNTDGSYDLKFLIEYKSQRYFYYGVVGSLITLLFTTALYFIRKKKV